MHPKTFFVRLNQPFNFANEAYLFHLHVDSAQEALSWVTRVFTSIEDEAARKQWPPRKNDTVIIQDCDAYPKNKGVAGKQSGVDAPKGSFRVSEEEVRADLMKIFRNLQSGRTRLAAFFKHLKYAYECDGVGWYRARLVEIKAAYEKALRWEERVWLEYLVLVKREELILPERNPKTL